MKRPTAEAGKATSGVIVLEVTVVVVMTIAKQ